MTMKSTLDAARLQCFAPVTSQQTAILILGSFPSVASLNAKEYYAHKRNQFWRLLAAVLEIEELPHLSYQVRLQRLLARNIGLWDVVGACEREGSLDGDIRNAQRNDFGLLKHRCPALKRVCFNGKAAGKFADKFAAGFETLVLPSSSPANAQLSFDEKLLVWRGIMAHLESISTRAPTAVACGA